MPHPDGSCGAPELLSPTQYYQACTITMSGYDFRKGQVNGEYEQMNHRHRR